MYLTFKSRHIIRRKKWCPDENMTCARGVVVFSVNK